MTDTRNPYFAAKYAPAALDPTSKRPGDRVLSLHRVQVINDHGGFEQAPPAYQHAPQVTPFTVLHGRGWEALGGVALGAVFIAIAVVLLAVSK